MKRPDNFLTNTTAPAGRIQGEATNDPGGSTGSGVDQEIYNDPAYAVIAISESWKEGGISDSDETTAASDMRDAIEEMTSKKVDGVSLWVIGTNYVAPGTSTDLVMWKGFQFINISNVGNLGNDPLLNPDLWYKIPKVDKLMDQYYSGEPVSGGLSPLADRAGAKYLQEMLFGNYRLGGNGDDFYNFFRVALDGTQVTGNATLEAIFDVGGGTEYFNLDLIAPDVVGTRTLIDMGERVLADQSVSGENDTMAEVLEDRSHDHDHAFLFVATGGTVDLSSSRFFAANAGGTGIATTLATTSSNSVLVAEPINGNRGSGTPRMGDTTRPKELTKGISYLIIMQAA